MHDIVIYCLVIVFNCKGLYIYIILIMVGKILKIFKQFLSQRASFWEALSYFIVQDYSFSSIQNESFAQNKSLEDEKEENWTS